MEKVILIDGNNLMFRSYYATAYSGSLLKNKQGFPTNALYGFINMINKIIQEEEPKYISVAFDIGKTFRHDSYTEYKKGRTETPEDLKKQFPKAKEILEAMGIKYLECLGYEADDIVGTISKMVTENENYTATIISSDKDLLQLINDKVEVKLLKQKEYIRMNKTTFYETYGIDPIKIIDLKALMGDQSDNIPGVKGIGEKTALKLLQKYNSLENIYVNINELTSSVKDKLINDKTNAFMSKSLATIYTEVPLNITFDDIILKSKNKEKLIEIYKELEFYTFLKKEQEHQINNQEIKIINDITKIKLSNETSIVIELDNENYHNANISGISFYNKEDYGFIPENILKNNYNIFSDTDILTYDLKKLYVTFQYHNVKLNNIKYDLMTAGYLLNYNIKDDIAYIANDLGYEINFYNKKENLDINTLAKRSIEKARIIYETKEKILEEMQKEEVLELYNNIEFPLSFVLAKMEHEGIRIDKTVLINMKEELQEKINLLTKEIYQIADEEFNISSPKQLGIILFEKLKLPHGKKNKNGNYSTDEQSLITLSQDYPIIDKILEYRMLTKLLATYVEGLLEQVLSDGKIHTIYTQTLTRTGRLSSIEPNLQNIPIRNEYGRKIRKAFIPEADSNILSADYSQIELRMFAHMSKVNELLEAFNNNMDIHTKTAMDIFKVSKENVTKDMRRKAKAVNFGIIYGISSYGLAQDLHISTKEAKEFIEKYFETYPGIKSYMNEEIQEAHKLGYVKTIMNRKRIINELNNPNYMIRNSGERMALNTPIQGSSADILKKSMIEIQNKIENKNLKSKMLLQVHDELIFNVYNNEKEELTKIVKETMENIYKLSVPLIVDIEYGNNWYEAK